MRFRGKDAVTVINTIDRVSRLTVPPSAIWFTHDVILLDFQALKGMEGREETRLNALRMLRNMAANACQVPKSYLIGRWTRYSVKKEILASGGFADVREGRLGGRAVAVKTLRISRQNDIKHVHKVCDATGSSIVHRFISMTLGSGLLQGIRRLDECIQPERPIAYRRRDPTAQ